VTSGATKAPGARSSWSLEEIRTAFANEGAASDLVDRALARLELSKASPRDRRDQMTVAIAVEFFSQATSTREVANVLSRDMAFPSTARWGNDLEPERRAQYRARLQGLHQHCKENDLGMPSAGTLRNILDGSRTPGKRQKTERFQLANFSQKKLASPPDLVGS